MNREPSRHSASLQCSYKDPDRWPTAWSTLQIPRFSTSLGLITKIRGKKDGWSSKMPDRWTAAARGRPLALVIKLHNCTDNESVCLRVKALGDTRRGSQPCWRCQKRSEEAPLPSAEGFRRRPFLFTRVTINQRNQFESTPPPKKIILLNSFAFTRAQKRMIPPKKEGLYLGMAWFTSGERSHLNPSVVNGAVNTKLLHSTCSPEH